MQKHYTLKNLLWASATGQVETAWVTLKKGDTAENPSSTSRVIYGPCQVFYTRYQDGGVDYEVVR